MATVNQVIAKVDELVPNAIEAGWKAAALLGLDRRIYEELTSQDDPDVRPPAAWPEDGDRELLASGAYEGLYELYLTSMVFFWQSEYAAYNNASALYDNALGEYMRQYRRTHMPKAQYFTGL